MPQIGAIVSGAVLLDVLAQRLEAAVRSRTNASLTSPSSTIVCIIALSSATSVSGLNCRKWVACRARSVRRGSATISFAPRFAAFLIQVAATGWLTVGLAPITKITSAFATSLTWFDTAPELMPSISAATLEAWQSRVQWSTLFVPKPVRTSFWKR